MRIDDATLGGGGATWARMAAVAIFICLLSLINASGASALGEQCSGSNITGWGSFLQTRAQSIWAGSSGEGFNGSKAPQGCGGEQGSGGKPTVSFVPLGSGASLHAWGADDGVFHDKSAKFIATSQPPAGPAEEEGTELFRISQAIDSDVAVIPVTQTAIAIVAHPPMLPGHAPCAVKEITTADLEQAFAGSLTNWRLLETASDPEAGGDCDQAITRVVRPEDSGTTYQFKHYLDQIDGEALECTGKTSRTWAQLQSGSGEANPNVTWPRKADCQEGEGPVTVATTNGEGPDGALGFVAESPGTLTYADLPAAKEIAPTWILDLDNGVEMASPSAGENDANCEAIKYAPPSGWESGVNVDWSQVYGSDPAIGEVDASAYPICTLTWDVAATSSFHVFGKNVATTVRNYFDYVRATETGKGGRHGHWYLGLPGAISEVAAVAIAQIDGEEGEEGEEEKEKEEEGKGAVLCKAAPEEAKGVLSCPPGEGYAGAVTGEPGSPASFVSTQGPEGTIKCEEAEFLGFFGEDGKGVETGLKSLFFAGCTSTLAGNPAGSVHFDNDPFNSSRFVYLSALAPQGAFVFGKPEGGQPLLRFSSKFTCLYQPSFLSGQVVNGSPTTLLLGGKWKLSEGTKECPEILQQTSELNLTTPKGAIYVASE